MVRLYPPPAGGHYKGIVLYKWGVGVMAYRVQSDVTLIDIYKHICDEILNDEQIKELGSGLVYDFDLVDVPVTTPITPRNTPRMYLIPQTTQYDLSSTANYLLTLNFQLVIEGFHFRNERLYKLV